MSEYVVRTLPGGLRVVVEEIPHVRSASIGVWVGAGSRFETLGEAGVSHFIEHLLFKGTERRTAKQIAEEMDALGGSLNAFTAKEQTCFYTKVLDEHVGDALDLLSDMVLHSVFDDTELEKEKGVILEEIKMYEDTPDELVHDLLAEQAWLGHPLGRVIIGTAPVVETLDRSRVLDYFGRFYRAGNVVVAVAGNVRADEVVGAVARAFAALPEGRVNRGGTPARVHTGRELRPKDSEQVHFCLGLPGVPQDHDEMYPLHVLNAILGGGSSSRLFQEIREERGLAYSVYSYLSLYRDSGLLTVYAGSSPEAAPEVLQLTMDELERLGHGAATEEEVERAKNQMKGQLVLGLESTSNRMTRLGRSLLSRGRVQTVDEVMAKVTSVTLASVNELAERLLDSQGVALAAIGPDLERLTDIPLAF